ncbi:MAG: hypothetical protein VX733_13570 [Candidatus Latescibacterota bacterium]|nr:hypothetical protein [Candidatus Latescibacterota bacterium]
MTSLLTGCGSDAEPVAPTKAERLTGTWHLEATQVLTATEEYELSYTFQPNGVVRNRVGGPFLAQLRELEELQDEDFGELRALDGGTLSWLGQWSLRGDSLHIVFDEVIVDIFGDVPIVGRLTLPIVEQPLESSQQSTLDFICSLDKDRLTLTGQFIAVGLADEPWVGGDAALPADLGSQVRAVTELALEFLSEQISASGADAHVFVR